MSLKIHKAKPKKVGGERETFDLEIEPVTVQIRRHWKERVVDALILFAIAVAAQVFLAIIIA